MKKSFRFRLKYVLLAVVPIAILLALQAHVQIKVSRYVAGINDNDPDLTRRFGPFSVFDPPITCRAAAIAPSWADYFAFRRRCTVVVNHEVDGASNSPTQNQPSRIQTYELGFGVSGEVKSSVEFRDKPSPLAPSE